MKRRQQLFIKGSKEAVQSVLTAMGKNLPKGWEREKEFEEMLQESMPGQWLPPVCYVCTRQGQREAALVSLSETQESDGVGVLNIAPIDMEEMNNTQYNTVLMDFFNQVVKPAASNQPVDVLLSSDEYDMAQSLGAKVLALLEAFSSQCDKDTGPIQHEDHQRWLGFLIATHRERADLQPDLLSSWLIDEGKWPAEMANDLAVEYEFARSLLEAYDEALGGAAAS